MAGPDVNMQSIERDHRGDMVGRWTDLDYVGLRRPAGWGRGRLQAPRPSTIITSDFGLLRLACQDIGCGSRQDTGHLNAIPDTLDAPWAPLQGVVNEIEMPDVFSAAATVALALDATVLFSADTKSTHPLGGFARSISRLALQAWIV